MSRKMTATHPTHGPFYLVSPKGGTLKIVGPSARLVAFFHVRNFGMTVVSVKEWQAARRKQQKEAV